MRDNAEVKVEQLLKDKLELKEMNQKTEGDLDKLKAFHKNIDKERDAAISELTCLAGDVDQIRAIVDELKEYGLK